MACDPNYLSFSDAEYQRAMAAVQARMDRLGLEAVVFYGSRTAPEIHYLCNWITTSEAYFIYPRKGRPDALRAVVQSPAQRQAHGRHRRRPLRRLRPHGLGGFGAAGAGEPEGPGSGEGQRGGFAAACPTDITCG